MDAIRPAAVWEVMLRALLASLAAAASIAGCTSDAERLVELRSDLATRLDALYELYGGGSLAAGAKEDARLQGEGGGMTARFFGEMDRAWFVAYCLAHGRGERPLNLSERLEAFVQAPAHREACRDAARLEVRIRELEARMARR